MSQVHLHDDLNELLDLVVTAKGSVSNGVARVASSCCCTCTVTIKLS